VEILEVVVQCSRAHCYSNWYSDSHFSVPLRFHTVKCRKKSAMSLASGRFEETLTDVGPMKAVSYGAPAGSGGGE